MQNRWSDKEASQYLDNPVSLRAYSSRLLGAESDLVLHGGGNTSVKVLERDFFGHEIEVLYVKGSGHDLATIKENGFAPVKLDVLKKLASFEQLTDTEMVLQQKIAMLNPDAPAPSVEAILHALIPFKYVDHTHADAVVTLTNTPKQKEYLAQIYGDEILILPYVMPGFILAKQVFEATQNIDWHKLKGIILLNHGVFTFSDDAKVAYENMLEIVTKAEELIFEKTHNELNFSHVPVDPTLVANIRGVICKHWEKAALCHFNSSELAQGFANLTNVEAIASRGTITPDHAIHTKQLPILFSENIEQSLEKYINAYDQYFERNNSGTLTRLDPIPRWGIIPGIGTMAFGTNPKRVQVVHDISEHTMKCIQYAEKLGGWKPLDEKNLFELEYWELEQAKLKKTASTGDFEGKIAFVTGAASGIGKATVEALVAGGCCVAAVDINPEVHKLFQSNSILTIECNVTNQTSLINAVQKTVLTYGGIDILISNAGSFPPGDQIEHIDNEVWDSIVTMNLTSHQRVLKTCIPFLKHGYEPSVVLVASKNVPAPGPGVSAYSAAKAGLTQLGRVAALELGAYGIRVNMVHPNQVFDTSIWSREVIKQRAQHYGMSIEDYKKNNILKTEVSSHDVAQLICFMSSAKFSKSTGVQIPIDGGNERVI